jgi:hypothetical protein
MLTLLTPEADTMLSFEFVGGRLSGKTVHVDAISENERSLFELMANETHQGLQGERVWVPFPDHTAVDEYEVDHRQRTDDDRVIARCYYRQTIPLPLPR